MTGPRTVRLTRMEKAGGECLSKRGEIGPDGKPVMHGSDCAMFAGTAFPVVVDGPAGLARLISSLTSSMALVAGSLVPEGDAIPIVTDKRADPAAGTYSRTLKNLRYIPGAPAVGLVDFDQKGMPRAVRERIKALGGIEAALASIIKGMDGCARVTRASTSAGLYNAETDERFPSNGGAHFYLFVEDGADFARMLKDAQGRAWLDGLGWIQVGKRGAKLVRSIVDISVGSPERLIFEGRPLLAHPLAQDEEERRPVPHDGPLLDTRAAVPHLTDEEEATLKALVSAAKEALEPEAATAREKAAVEISAERGIPIERARVLISSSLRGTILDGDTLDFDDPAIGRVTVAEVLRDPDRYHEETLADPIEGREYGRAKAKLFANASGKIIINSFAHGAGLYRLKLSPDTIGELVQAADAKEAPFLLARLLPHCSDRNRVDEERLVKLAAKVGDVGVRAVKSLISEASAKRRAEAEEKREGGPVDAGDPLAPLLAAVEELNKSYFVADMAGRGVIASIAMDSALERERLVLSKREDIRLLYNHRHVLTGWSSKGFEIWKDVGSAWIEHPNRRTYRRIELIPSGDCPPDTFNLWRGFGVEPKAGPFKTIEWHLRNIICSGDPDHFAYLMDWLAYCVQHPERQAEVAIVFRGKKGTGKGFVGQLMRTVFNGHSLQITQARHLVGNFNSHLADILFLFVDEAFWAGDKQGEGVLKGLITEPTLTIEPKGIDAFQVRNMLKILMASNNDWVVPATGDERRYFVLDVAEDKRGDTVYFRKLWATLKGEELQGFLHHLLNRDLSAFELRTVPHTAALDEQKLISGDAATRFWSTCLHAGYIVNGSAEGVWHTEHAVEDVYLAYQTFCTEIGERHPVTREQLGMTLRKLIWPDRTTTRTIRPKPKDGGPRPRCYAFDDLETCRRTFSDVMSYGGTWETDDEPDEGNG